MGTQEKTAPKLCEFPGCDRPRRAAGLCGGHRMQVLRGQALRPLRPFSATGVCEFDGCGRAHAAQGLCSGHWAQQRQGRALQPLLRRVIPESSVCMIADCSRPHSAHGMCDTHRRRQRVYGDPRATPPIGGPLKGEHPTVGAMHRRVRKAKGAARGHQCVDCGARADEWSYNNADPNELLGEDHGSQLAYSLDVANYEPRCRSCHRQFDAEERRRRNAAEEDAA